MNKRELRWNVRATKSEGATTQRSISTGERAASSNTTIIEELDNSGMHAKIKILIKLLELVYPHRDRIISFSVHKVIKNELKNGFIIHNQPWFGLDLKKLRVPLPANLLACSM